LDPNAINDEYDSTYLFNAYTSVGYIILYGCYHLPGRC